MNKTNYTYCRGHHCLLKSNCKRFLNRKYTNPEATNVIDSCDEQERKMFDPQKKSE